jgi:hypothetical protein
MIKETYSMAKQHMERKCETWHNDEEEDFRKQSNERSKGEGDRNNPTTRQMRCISGVKMRRETAEHSPSTEE